MVNRDYKSIWANPHVWRIAVIMVACSLYYYLDVFAGFVGWTSLEVALSRFHDFHGLIFFIPVVYAAYTFGLIGALIIALIAMFILFPYALIVTPYSNALYRPTAFGIILSAVGAAIALLQRIDKQRNRYMKELECLYDIGNTPDMSCPIDKFLSSAVETISEAIQYPEKTSIRITMKGKAYESKDFKETSNNTKKAISVGGNILGSIDVYSKKPLKEESNLIETFADRISIAVHRIELEQSLSII